MDYILVIYGPVALLAAFGLYLILSKSIIVQIVAIAAPTILAGFEILSIYPVGSDQDETLADILFVQAGALGMLALAFLIILFLVRPELWKLDKRTASRPTVYES